MSWCVGSMQDLVLAALTRLPGGGWHLDPAQSEPLAERLDTLARKATDPAAAARPVLKLIAALEADGASGSAAHTLVETLRRAPVIYEALAQAKAQRSGRAQRARSRLSSFEGRQDASTAPLHDAPAPQGSLPARELIRPLRPR